MDKSTRENITELSTWTRMVFVLLYSVVLNFVGVLLAGIVVVQFLAQLFTGRTVPRLRRLGKAMARYVHDVILFISYQSELRPYPFAAWPETLDDPNPIPQHEGI